MKSILFILEVINVGIKDILRHFYLSLTLSVTEKYPVDQYEVLGIILKF